MKTSTRLAVPFFYALLMSACSNNESVPTNFVGFERRIEKHTYDVSHQEETITLKIVAGTKQDKDLKLNISSSSTPGAFKIQDVTPVIPKGKKAVKVNVLLYPKKISNGQRVLHFTCRPEGKDAKVSEISIHLQKK